ncbi:MAG TPA: hypothetical protein PKW75_10600 [candidate division Zixibacteria bacterium]|nr:hypothetical protein [candidate division Zixibacteria bacterium]MDD4916649.1 hypothetical protein [candidate division Zixibacteria bacterium]MDM7973207.1 hypothetical protein [candidate division Zixibacteria bacterium]HOD67060.1 hypothetical protein [candidate division Zixibacteria bacterium]HOZ08725.1 hypothetical protein [candidate division Zixibacteria bacterium]
MRDEGNEDRYDLARMIAGSLYQGLFINILLPAGLLLAAYVIEQRGGLGNALGAAANPLFYVLAVVSVAEGAAAVLWRSKTLALPMVRRIETLEEDIRGELRVRLRPVFLLIAGIALNGFAYFLLTGRFREGLVFVVLSFLAFQIVRPRYGMVRGLIKQQEDLAARGLLRTQRRPGELT